MSGIRVTAHDSGDGQTVYHCPFDGGGQVIGRSDGTIECEFCGTAFTVQVQPLFSGFPQTINGVPSPIPGMPGQIDAGPAAPLGDDPAAQDDGNPFATDDTQDTEDGAPDEPPPGDDGDQADAPPPKKAAVYRTSTGARLSARAYVEHLAIRHATMDERDAVLMRIRARRPR